MDRDQAVASTGVSANRMNRVMSRKPLLSEPIKGGVDTRNVAGELCFDGRVNGGERSERTTSAG